ncbi:MAG: hypothetical protein N2449_00695 [Bacteroidales bacterium]|nr:hypothetical protein [Bacteroidales bacterium]
MKTIFIATALFLFLQNGYSQHQQCKHREQIKAQKVAFLTNKLDLTVQEAQAFWPLYNEFEKKKDDIFDAQRNLYTQLDNNTTISDKEMVELADKYIELEVAEAKLLAEYHAKFKKVLPIRKVVILYSSDRMFKKELLKQLKNCPNQPDK